MAFQPTKRQGFQRLSETENTRQLTTKADPKVKIGNTCKGCNCYSNHMKSSDKYCSSCSKRLQDL